jgi:hypothetical protein
MNHLCEVVCTSLGHLQKNGDWEDEIHGRPIAGFVFDNNPVCKTTNMNKYLQP